MKTIAIIISTLVCFANYSEAQKLPDVFDIQFAVYPTSGGESVEISMVSMKDPLMATLIGKQILAQVKSEISSSNISSLYIQSDFIFLDFTNELFEERMIFQEEFVNVDEYGDEKVSTEEIKYSIDDLNVSLNFSIGYDLDKNMLHAKLVSADFLLTINGGYEDMNIRIMRKVYGDQPKFQMTVENDLYSNMFFDDQFEIQDYNYLISVPLSDINGWALNQKMISYLPISKVYFEKNNIPKKVYTSYQEEVTHQGTLIKEYEVEDLDEYGDFVILQITDTLVVDQLVVYYNIRCALEEVISVKEVEVIGYGVEDYMDGMSGIFNFFYFEPR